MSADLDRLTNEILARVEKISRESSAKAPALIDVPPAVTSTPATMSTEPPVSSQPTEVSVPQAASITPVTHRIDAPAPRMPEAHLAPERSPLPSAASQPTAPQSSASPLLWVATARKNFGLMNNIGQGLSYVGILGITLGLSLVVLGTFGASSHLAPTGWLIATLGQMLLLLGVVTSVTVGMEQSSAEMRLMVDERMRSLTEQIEQLRQQPTRVDQAHAEIPAPHFVPNSQRTIARSDPIHGVEQTVGTG